MDAGGGDTYGEKIKERYFRIDKRAAEKISASQSAGSKPEEPLI
ncbi:hypothetical protein DIV12_30080 [Escherichia coli]|nr:hypothetical protein DIV12_30080 [Escherichia coli]